MYLTLLMWVGSESHNIQYQQVKRYLTAMARKTQHFIDPSTSIFCSLLLVPIKYSAHSIILTLFFLESRCQPFLLNTHLYGNMHHLKVQ